MNYLVLFETPGHAERAGLMPGYTTAIGDLHVVILRIPHLPWGVIRECVTYVQSDKNYALAEDEIEEYSRAYLQGIITEVLALNLAPVKINQW
jgi:hypothetical protein